MITEDYVNYKIAELLKEKGFDSPTGACYNSNYGSQILVTGHASNHNSSINSLSCPTLQMAMKWLREVHKIFVEPFVVIDLNGKYHYCFRLLNSICKDILKPKDLVRIDFEDTYKGACEAAIKYCLENLI